MVFSFLSRKPKAKLAWGIIIIGLLLASPPLAPWLIFTEIYGNIPIANFIVRQTGIDLLFALFLSFTLIPAILIYVGAFIMPRETASVLHGIRNRIRNGVMKYIHLVKKNPLNIIWFLLSILIVYWFYTTNVITI